jgi:hypothetical protein
MMAKEVFLLQKEPKVIVPMHSGETRSPVRPI